MISKNTYIQRQKSLRDVLKTIKREGREFDMKYVTCGTGHCHLGWLPSLLPETGLTMKYGGVLTGDSASIEDAVKHVAEWCGLPVETISALFRTAVCLPGETTLFKEVIRAGEDTKKLISLWNREIKKFKINE